MISLQICGESGAELGAEPGSAGRGSSCRLPQRSLGRTGARGFPVLCCAPIPGGVLGCYGSDGGVPLPWGVPLPRGGAGGGDGQVQHMGPFSNSLSLNQLKIRVGIALSHCITLGKT